MVITKDIDQFVGKVYKQGNSLAVVIPNNNVKFAGLEDGDGIKIWFKKIKK